MKLFYAFSSAIVCKVLVFEERDTIQSNDNRHDFENTGHSK